VFRKEKQVAMNDANKQQDNFKIVKTEKEWRAQLSDIEFFVLREEGTERAFSSELLKNKGAGTYTCAACVPLFLKVNINSTLAQVGLVLIEKLKGMLALTWIIKLATKRTEEYCANLRVGI